MKRIFITHCSKGKNEQLASMGACVTPDRLYTSPALQDFIRHCQINHLDWAIFSDHYGVVFPTERIGWYNKPPDTVTPEEARMLEENFIQRLGEYDEIIFYHRPGEKHSLFLKIVENALTHGMPVKNIDALDHLEFWQGL